MESVRNSHSYSPVANAPDIVQAEHTVLNQDTSYEGAAGRKSFASVDVQEIQNSSTSSPRVSKQTWSFIGAKRSDEKRSSTPNSSRSSAFFKTSSWTFEIVSLFVGLGAIVGIIAVLACFNGQALPKWPYDITLNALIALLATIANANMAVPLQSGLSQLKWIRFRAGRAPLSDMEAFDEASRGTWGAIKLLITARGGIFGSFGAVIAIVALAIGPFAQQIATYRMRTISIPETAFIPRSLNYTGALPGNSSSTGFVPILPMKAAVYNGLFAENNRPAAILPVACPTGNCTWNPFDTLAVCTECIDISSFMERWCNPSASSTNSSDLSTCGWRVPQGAVLSSAEEVFSMTSLLPSPYGNMPHSTIMRLIFMGTESQTVANALNPWALQCSLQGCVQSMNSSVINGAVTETVLSTKFNTTVVDMSKPAFDPEVGHTVYLTGSDNSTYLLSQGALLAMRGWFGTLFRNGSATRTSTAFNRTIDDDAVVVNLTVGISSGETFFDSDIVTAFYWNYYQYPSGLQMLMSDLASSMTTAFRSFMGAEPVVGTALATESYVHVRWGFIALPIAVVALTAMFLAAAMWRTKASGSKLWKSSALAMLFHGLDSGTREKFGRGGSLEEKRKWARGVRVQLDEGDSGSLLRD